MLPLERVSTWPRLTLRVERVIEILFCLLGSLLEYTHLMSFPIFWHSLSKQSFYAWDSCFFWAAAVEDQFHIWLTLTSHFPTLLTYQSLRADYYPEVVTLITIPSFWVLSLCVRFLFFFFYLGNVFWSPKTFSIHHNRAKRNLSNYVPILFGVFFCDGTYQSIYLLNMNLWKTEIMSHSFFIPRFYYYAWSLANAW